MHSTHRIIYNTGILYVKLIIVIVISFINVRLVLNALGETDYGIYTLVAGVVGMLGVMQSAMTTASMRFMAHSLGGGNKFFIKQTFNTTLLLHIVIGVIVVAIIEFGGFFMFKYLLNIPPNKIIDAKIVFHFMAATTFVTIIAVPYDAVINSHENLFFLSIVDVFGAILKLGVAIYLSYTNFNLLIFYGAGLLIVQIIMRVIKQLYSIKRYEECSIQFKKYYSKELTRSILSFSGWNLFGSIASMIVTQLRSVLLNMFFGVRINASDGITKNVSSFVNQFSSSLTRAINPQLVKNEGGGNRDKMITLTLFSTKYSSILFSFLVLPLMIEMSFILSVWLKNPPEYASLFSRLVLINLIIGKLSFEITNALRAAGDIKAFQITETVIYFFNIIFSFLLFNLDFPPSSIYVVGIIFGFVVFIERLYFGHIKIKLNVYDFIRKAVYPVVLTFSIAALLSIFPLLFLKEGFFRLGVIATISTFTQAIVFIKIGLSVSEYAKIKDVLKKLIN